MMKFIITVLALLVINSSLSKSCVVMPCDLSILYSMAKQRSALETRLDELKRVIHALAEGSLYLAGLHAKEIKELIRLRERMKLENLAAYEIAFHAKILKEIENTKRLKREKVDSDE